MKSDNEVRNGRGHRKGVGAGGGHSPFPREAQTLFVAVRPKCNLKRYIAPL